MNFTEDMIRGIGGDMIQSLISFSGRFNVNQWEPGNRGFFNACRKCNFGSMINTVSI
jgi:hypothetical protein